MRNQCQNEMVEAVKTMFNSGWSVLPVKRRGKQPLIARWQENRIKTIEHVEQIWSEPENVGVALGPASGHLHDLDLDILEVVPFVDILFRHLPGFGRPSKPRSHRLVCIPDAKKGKEAFVHNKQTVLEIRGQHHFTVFPPSIHPSGEEIEYFQQNPIPEMKWNEVVRLARICSGLGLLLRHYPDEAGCRNDLCLALTTVLVQLDLDDRTADSLVTTMAKAGDDEEWTTRGGCAAATRGKIADGEPVTGLTRVLELLGVEDDEKLRSTIYRWLGADNGSVPKIVVGDGRLNEVLRAAEDALLANGPCVYNRGSELVRVVKHLQPSESTDPIQRDVGALLIRTVTKPWLIGEFARVARWLKRASDQILRPIDPPPKYAEHYIAAEGDRRLPVLNGIINAPTLRPDGSVLQTPGYDPSTGLLYVPQKSNAFSLIPEKPSQEDAIAAMHQIKKLFCKFPFVSKAAESVVLAGVLTGLIRRSLSTAPLFLLDAPTPGTGKSLIAKVIGTIATGHAPADMSQGPHDEELEKRLFTALRDGDAVILIDNVTRMLEGDLFCSMLTSPEITGRILGRSESSRMPTSALVMATGNNIRVRADMCRRVLVSRLDAGMEHPEARQFDFDPLEIARTSRENLVVAGLTALRAYHVAQRPNPLPKLGSFEAWNWVRETLVWLDYHDPVATQSIVHEDDQASGELAEVLVHWYRRLDSRRTLVSELWEVGGTESDLMTLLIDRCGGHWSAKKFGWWLRRHQDQIAAGYQLKRGHDKHKQATWYVVEVEHQAQGTGE